MNATNHSNAAFLEIDASGFRVDSPEVRVAAETNWWARTPTGLAVLRYQECHELLRNQQLRIGVADVAAGFGAASSTLFDWLKAIRLSFDGASNRWRRLLVSKAFTQRSIDALRPFMRSRTHELIDSFASNGNCEFMAAFADPYPASVMAKLFGIPPERSETFLGWATDVGLALNPAGAAKLDRINTASAGLHSCFEELVEQRRENPGDDFVSTLLTSEFEGKSLTSEEVCTLLSILIFGSQAAIRNQLGLAMLTFSRHPEQWRLLVERPELARTAVDELMRINPAVTAIPRVSAEDFTFQGVDIASGTRVLLFTSAANTQPDIFGDASFDITAQRPPHLTFGAGVHYCPGAALARAQMSEALLILASRLGDVTLTEPPNLRPRPGLTGPVTVSLRSS